MNVLHGMSEVAGQGIYSVEGLLNNDVNANMAVWSKNPMHYPVDIDLKIDKSKKTLFPFYAIKILVFAIKSLVKYDCFHFHYGYTLIPYNLEIFIYNILGKKYFVEFHGSDLRFLFNDIKYKYYEDEGKINKEQQQQRIKKIIDKSSGVILHDFELIKHLPDIKVPLYIVPLRVDINRFKPVYPPREKRKPIIVHAPSRRRTKGTDEILKILDTIKDDYELILVEGKSQDEAIEIYKKADIIIDQISVGTYGVFAIEAMALGKPVITYIDDENRELLPEELPIVSAGFSNLKEKIEELIGNGDLRNKLGLQGRKYVERYHDNNKISKELIKIYKGTIEDNNVFNLLKEGE